jgi:hypothetical protein
VDPLHLTHLVLVSLWGGLVLGESVLELSARDQAGREHAARIHFWMDVLLELPLLLGALATGAWLTWRAWPPTTLHVIKIVAALVAVTLNLYCIGVVVARYRRRADVSSVERDSKRVRLSGLGIPFALVAAYIGVMYFRR